MPNENIEIEYRRLARVKILSEPPATNVSKTFAPDNSGSLLTDISNGGYASAASWSSLKVDVEQPHHRRCTKRRCSAALPPIDPPPSPSPFKFPKTNPRFKIPLKNYSIPVPLAVPLLAPSGRREMAPDGWPSTSSDTSWGASPKLSVGDMSTSTKCGVDEEAEVILMDARRPDARRSLSATPPNSNQQISRIIAGIKDFGIKGELFLTILVDRRLLTATIERANNLIPPTGFSSCCAYARLSLIPDDDRRFHFKTKLVPNSNKPDFNETFTIDLLPTDYEKRLLVSLWHRTAVFGKSVFLGCMSFTVRHLSHPKKHVDGWYFLLSPQYGKRKHLAVHKVTMLTYYGPLDDNRVSSADQLKRYIL